MTISIHIEAHPDRGDMGKQVEQAMSALGFHRSVSSAAVAAARDAFATGTGVVEMKADGTAERIAPEDFRQSGEEQAAETADAPAVAQTATQIDTRPVGSPAEGNKRRNSAEKSEDDEFEKLAAEKGVPLDKLNAGIAAAGRAEAKAQLSTLDVADKQIAAISTGEERIGPEDMADDPVLSRGNISSSPEDEQDAADEAAETEKSGLAPIDVLRRLLGDYQKKHGMPAAVKLCQEGGLIGAPIHELDDAGIEKAIAALSVSPLSPETKAETKPVETVAPKTKADLIEAMMRYGDKFDGTREQAKMKFTLEDCPRIFVSVFGDAVTKLSQVPEDGYGRAVAAIEQAIATDPFGRAK